MDSNLKVSQKSLQQGNDKGVNFQLQPRLGFTAMHTAIGSGRRSTTFTGFVQPFEEIRENLTVIQYADVTEVSCCINP